MTKNNLNIGAVLFHVYEGVEYKISGRIVGINENDETCTMKFANGRVETGIPMSEVFVNEGIVDKIKQYGKRVIDWIVQKVKGFVCFLAPGGKVSGNSFLNPINMFAAYGKGEFNPAIKMFPSAELVEAGRNYGVSIPAADDDDILTEACNRDIERINEYWTRVMNVAGTTDKTVEESVNYVNKKYYKTSRLFEAMCESKKETMRQLNEDKEANPTGIFSMDQVADFYKRKNYGKRVNTKELKGAIKTNIERQLKVNTRLEIKELEDEAQEEGLSANDQEYLESALKAVNSTKPFERKPALIWGAPGIGKTSIVRQVLKDMKRTSNGVMNLSIVEVNCAQMQKDDFTLPDKTTMDAFAEDGSEIRIRRMEHVPLSWLPVYMPTGNEAQDQWWENYYAGCCNRIEQKPQYATNHPNSRDDLVSFEKGDGSREGANGLRYLVDSQGDRYTGGILFFDEVARMEGATQSKMMAICHGTLDEYKMANSWGVIGASNRAEDDPQQDVEATTQPAWVDRWDDYLFVPEMEEWIEWARQTGDDGLVNVHPDIVDFIEYGGEKVWYSAIMFGSYDREMEQLAKDKKFADPNFKYDGADSIRHDENKVRNLYQQIISLDDDEATEKTLDPRYGTRITYTPRAWTQISKNFNDILKGILKFNVDKEWKYRGCLKKSRDEYDVNYIHPNVLTEAIHQIPDEYWPEIVSQYCPGFRVRGKKMSDYEKDEIINQIMINLIEVGTGSDQSLPSIMYKEYQKWRKLFADPEVINSIYNNAELPGDKGEQDKIPYQNAGGFQWKKDTATVLKVINYILAQYPGDGVGDFMEYIDYVNGALSNYGDEFAVLANSKNAKTEQKIKEITKNSFTPTTPYDEKGLTEFLTIIPASGDKYMLFPIKKLSDDNKKILWHLINTYEFYRYILNFAKYLCRMSLNGTSFSMSQLYTSKKETMPVQQMIQSNILKGNQEALKKQTDFNKKCNGILAAMKNDDITAMIQISGVYQMIKAMMSHCFNGNIKKNAQ